MSMERMLDFLRDLERNNDRAWFHAHKPAYQQASADFENLVRQLNLSLREGDASLPMAEPKSLTFKLMRDTRFSHDKSPYNPSFRAHIGPAGKLPIPVGYYLMIKPGDRSFLGGGLFADMFPDATARVREHIAAHGERWAAILAEPDFAARFTVGGTALKNLPKGYASDHPRGQYLKHKSWYLELPIPDRQLLEADFVHQATELFLKMRPFNDFLNQALSGFQMPAR